MFYVIHDILLKVSLNTNKTGHNVQREIDIYTEVLGIVNGEIVKVTDESVQKEIDINTEVLGIVNGEIVKVADESVQKEIDITTEVLGIVNKFIIQSQEIKYIIQTSRSK